MAGRGRIATDPDEGIVAQEQDAVATPEIASVDMDGEQDAPDPTAVTLSDGRVARLRRTTGLDEEAVETRLSKWRYSLDGLDAITFERIQAVYGIETIDGAVFTLVDEQGQATEAALDAFLLKEKLRDLLLIQRGYDALNGLGAPTPAASRPLGPAEVALSDGHIVRVREETGKDEFRRNRLLSDFGYAAVGLGQISYGRAAALMAVEAIDGQLRRMPQTHTALNAYLTWWASDILIVINKHNEVNGVGRTPAFRG